MRPTTGVSTDALLGNARSRRGLAPGWIALAWIYLLWGSNFVALRVVVAELPPFFVAGCRYASVGAILCVAAVVLERPIHVDWADARRYALTGVAMFLFGNGLLSQGIQHVPSATAAILTATIPLWMVGFETIQGRLQLNRFVGAGLIGGIVGVVVIAGPFWGEVIDVVAAAAILLGAASWAIGSLSARHHAPRHGPLTVIAIQTIAGSGALLTASAIAGDFGAVRLGSVTGDAWLALAWLVLPTGVMTFASYTYALRVFAASMVAVYPLVNTVVAVFLGWLILAEQVTGVTVLGCALVLAGAGIVAIRSPAPGPLAAPT